jgi:predicted O-methyltransferase YrrM
MDFISPELQQYVTDHSSAVSPLLSKIDRETHLEVLQPRMLSGHFQGRVLSMLAQLLKPSAILEIGTYTGYSALCLAEGLQKDGKLITIDCNEDLMHFTSDVFAKSPYHNQIEFLCGDAMDLIPSLTDTFDLVFIDADKSNYLNYYNLVLPKVRSGGLIIADNVLWSGKVLDLENNTDLDTVAIHEFNKTVHEDTRVQEVLLPIRDGLLLVRKL